MIRRLLLQIQFFTRIPIPFPVTFDEESFARGIVFVPLVGLLIGAPLGAVYYLAQSFSTPLLAAVAVLLFWIFITGGLHLDGLADTCDGIFSNRPGEEILVIMKDSRIGTNGTIALVMLLLLKLALLAAIPQDRALEVIIVPVIARMNIVWSSGIARYARAEKGMGGMVVSRTGKKQIIISTLLTLAVSAGLFRWWLALPLVAGAALFAVLFTLYIKKKIGGVTGDTLGALVECSEAAVLAAGLAIASL